MTKQSVIPELDVFNLPVFADANIWAMWPAEKLNELAEDIKENGFDHRYPLTIAEVDGVWMLLDGRNRREAARIAGITPPVIVTDIDPKLAVHRSNNQNRDATPGQKAMATAMTFPEAQKGGDRKSSCFKQLDFNGFDKSLLSRARFVLRNNPIAESKVYPQRCLDIMAGSLSLTEAYELTQADVKRREEEEKIRAENAAKLADVRSRYPDLATAYDDDRITLNDAIASAEARDRQTAEQKRREREAEEARMADEERQRYEQQRKEQERYEANRAAFHSSLNNLLSGSVIVINPADCENPEKWKGTWTAFYNRYQISIQDARTRLEALHERIPFILKTLEAMRNE